MVGGLGKPEGLTTGYYVKPTVFAGVNQTIMMALAMVVIASMIGVKGLGVPILRAISNQYLALGLFNGLAIVALAIIFDRITQEYGRRIQKHRGIKRSVSYTHLRAHET